MEIMVKIKRLPERFNLKQLLVIPGLQPGLYPLSNAGRFPV